MPTKSFDAIIIGGGIIGLSLALELRGSLRSVLVLDRSEPGREASSAAAGMLNACDVKEPRELAALAHASAELFPSYIDAIRARSDIKIDFQRTGALSIGDGKDGVPLSPAELSSLEPGVTAVAHPVHFVQEEDAVDPRTLMAALIDAARNQDIHLVTGTAVESVLTQAGAALGVRTARSEYHSGVVVNCAGAWAKEIGGADVPARPVKGQMISLLPRETGIRHVIRAAEPDIYMLPRAGGLVAVGATVEEAGFDKQVDPDTARSLQAAAAAIVPSLADAKMQEAWAGLRPALPDKLPAIGPTSARGIYIATGHYRHGILLAPATARALAELILSGGTSFDLSRFSARRFA